jgi:DNA-binding LacI/PurR family transcriptional regulator
MLPRRITMQDVAREAAVHQTTVSLALRNDPRLPEKTRARIRRAARKLGYEPDPMLSALNFYRSSRHAVKAPPTMAFLLNFKDQAEMSASSPHRLFLEGARHQARQIGYQLDAFFVGHARREIERIEHVLRARSITGVIVGGFGDMLTELQLNWDYFSAVLIESYQLHLPLHLVSNHQTQITREAVRRLAALGYRRIGLAVGEREELYLQHAFATGYHGEIALHPELAAAPPLLLRGLTMPLSDQAAEVGAWVRRHDFDAVISDWHSTLEAARLAGFRCPGDLTVASLDVLEGYGANAGMTHNHDIVGRRAVEQLAILMKTNQRGFVRPPNTTLIEGTWVDGSDVPKRKPMRARAAAPAGVK